MFIFDSLKYKEKNLDKDKNKEKKQKHNTSNAFRNKMFSQPKKDLTKEHYCMNINLHLNSEVFNHCNTTQKDSNIIRQSCNKNSNSHNNSNSNNKLRNNKHISKVHLIHDDILKEKDKMILILQKELKVNKEMLFKLFKNKGDKSQYISLNEESMQYDNQHNQNLISNNHIPPTKSLRSINILSYNNNNHYHNRHIFNSNNTLSTPNLNEKAILHHYCSSSSLNLETDAFTKNNNRSNSNNRTINISLTLLNSLTNETVKPIRLTDVNSNHIDKGKSNNNNKLSGKKVNKTKITKIKVVSLSSFQGSQSAVEVLRSQCEAIKYRTKLLLHEYNKVLIQDNGDFRKIHFD